jgi:methylmalonyl-CoA/ethylmalonyl-CoA epimerase
MKPAVAHIGIAVTNIDAALSFYRDVLGLSPGKPESADGATIVSLPFGDVDVELLEPRTPDSPVAKFLAKRGPGIHHVCYRVPDLEAALARCRSAGFQLIDETPRRGAGGRRIAFLHPKTTNGILLELTE